MSKKQKLINYIKTAIKLEQKYLAIVFKNSQGNSVNVIDSNLFGCYINDIEDLYNDDLESMYAQEIKDYISCNNFDVIESLMKLNLN